MATSYKSHGSWSRYEPTADQIPAGAPSGAMYAKRDADGVDWYAYSRDPKSFTDGSVKLVLVQLSSGLAVASAALDATRLFPQAATLLEVIGTGIANDNDALAAYRGKLVDLANDTFTDPPAPPAITNKADIWRRCTDDEANTLTNLLAAQPLRQRQLYNDALNLTHSDPMYQTLYSSVVQALGQARADAILAPS